MIQKIRTSRISKIVASYLAIQMIVTMIQPMNLYALGSGPTQPEFNAFTPIGTSDMVNLASGDFNYNIPIMDVGGYPINLAYDSGITSGQDASWVGLGWNMNIGQISRDVRGIPDDFKGDEMTYENEMRRNVTVGSNFGIEGHLFGLPDFLELSIGMGVQYNNYEGISFHPSYGASFDLHRNVSVGLDISTSTAGGASVTPSVEFNTIAKDAVAGDVDPSLGLGLSMNSRKGLESLSISAGIKRSNGIDEDGIKIDPSTQNIKSGRISFNNNNVYTPQKRAGMVSGNFSFSGSWGIEGFGVEVDGKIQGYGSYQDIRGSEERKQIPAFGYNFQEFADKSNSVLDFTREKDRTFNRNSTVLPIANQTYDIYSMQAQGLSGMIRPHRGQVSYLMDNEVTDKGDGASVGIEFGQGWLVHGGVDVEVNPSYGRSGGWTNGNFALPRFEESNSDLNSLDYEPVYFKQVGEMNIDAEVELFEELHGVSAMDLVRSGTTHARRLNPTYRVKNYNPNGTPLYQNFNIGSKAKRSEREKRNTSIQQISHAEAANYGLVEQRADSRILDHHTAGIKILKPDGATYVFGETAYNWTKEELTVDVSGAGSGNCETGIITSNNDAVSPNPRSDEYKNNIITPAYAHTYLLSSVLSADYEDLGNDGPTEDDLGSYTRFNYGTSSEYYIPNYSWRTPWGNGNLNYNEGLKSLNTDQKGSVIKGTKELRYIRTIETKTHIAYFRLSERKDAMESTNSGNPDHMMKIDNIFLFTKPEFDNLETTLGNADGISTEVLAKEAIKTAYFQYDYELCQGIPNRTGGVDGPVELANQGGKLTLKKVFFTYRGSNMGRYTPYEFNYGYNPDYSLKGYDIWGNYKDNSGAQCGIEGDPTTSEFPFVEQDYDLAKDNTGAWNLTSIKLPSGGLMEIETESDDYQYVQDRKAMQMFMIEGFGDNDPQNNGSSDVLYNGSTHKEYVHVRIDPVDDPATYTGDDFLSEYLSESAYDPIFFRALLNMSRENNGQHDFVNGYFMIEPGADGVITGADFGFKFASDHTIVAIPMKFLDMEGGWDLPSNEEVNPISKAGWFFGRKQLNRVVYSLGGDAVNDDFESIVRDLITSVTAAYEIFTGPNLKLQNNQIARWIQPLKSYIRLEHKNGQKFGGGLRVKSIRLNDQWSVMDLDPSNDNLPEYQQFYGQEYSYTLPDGSSSGVAAYEPNASKENPFVEPLFDNSGNGNDKLVAPKEQNYTEKPFGESFFPAAKVTYSRVEVKNLAREDANLGVVGKHATGKVVTEFYTTRDFPTKTDYTKISPQYDPPNQLNGFFFLNVVNHLAFSQGFVVETNDMDGRQKSQRVFAEGQEAAISGVDYYYNLDDNGNLSNTVATIDKDGKATNMSTVGLTFDVYHDFRETYSESETVGIDFNAAAFILFIVPIIVPTPLPTHAYHETKLNTASTTKVIHRTGILKETVAFDLGATVSTRNLMWDAHNGDVVLTETENEYNDNYYSLSYPAHWYYNGMDMASQNVGISGSLIKEDQSNVFTFTNGIGDNMTDIFYKGDELQAFVNGAFQRLWVASVSDVDIQLMGADGVLLNDECDELAVDFTIIRSGFRNQQMASMASVTSMTNPIQIDFDPADDADPQFDQLDADSFVVTSGDSSEKNIVNASAVEYSEAWVPQWELGLPKFNDDFVTTFEQVDYGNFPSPDVEATAYGFNPYLYNVRGDWRAKRSYAPLTGRRSHSEGTSSPRFEGFFDEFVPFYKRNGIYPNNNYWEKAPSSWTSASRVSQYSPFGAELENIDALGRFSAAQYGYNYTLPTAVASNTAYNQIGFDGFEDYSYLPGQNNNDLHFGMFNGGQATLVNSTSHTGQYSMRVNPNQSTSVSVDIDDLGYTYNYPGPEDCEIVDPPSCETYVLKLRDWEFDPVTNDFTATVEILYTEDIDLFYHACSECEPSLEGTFTWYPDPPTSNKWFTYKIPCVGGPPCMNPPADQLFLSIGDYSNCSEGCCQQSVNLNPE